MQNLSLIETNFPPVIIDNSLSINLNHCINPNLTIFSSLTETKSYVPISACVFEHIITTDNLTNNEKLYYLLADALALISKNKGGHRAASLPSEEWAIRLGYSRSSVFAMQKSLEEKGYFIINKDFDKIGRNKRNLIIPTLPISVFNSLNDKYQNKIKKESLEEERQLYNSSTECMRSYLDRTQLFIKLNYNLLKAITSNKNLNAQQKVIWLGFYTRCYKNYMSPMTENANLNKYSNNIDSSFSFVASYKELADYYSYNIKHLSKSIKALEEASFIQTQHFYIKEKISGNNADENYSNNQGGDGGCYYMQERQDKSLWKITLLLPEICAYELGKLKDRANLNLSYPNTKVVTVGNSVNSEVGQDYLMLGGMKLSLNLEQISLLKSVISANCNTASNLPTSSSQESNPVDDTYVDSVIEELDIEDKIEELEPLENMDSKGDGIKSDPPFAKSRLLLNKDLKLKIKELKSNLGATPKVLFNKFLKSFKSSDKNDYIENEERENQKEKFNISSELIKQKIKELPKEKADKARKFAYSLISKKLACGYAAGLSKHELAKQLIFHTATWKPTKLGTISREKEIDTALSVAWRAVENGTWQVPLEWSKAQILQAEFNCYAQKYKESGIISNELGSLELATKKLLKSSFINLKSIIIEQVGVFASGFETAPNKDLVPLTEANNHQEHSSLLTHEKDIEPPPFPEEQEAYLSYSNLHPMDSVNTNCCENKEEYSASRMFDLSSLPAQEKYLRMTFLEINNEVVVKTVDDNQFIFKYKAMEVDSEGEVAIILDKVKLKSLIKDLNDGLLSQNSNILVNNDLSSNLDALTDNRGSDNKGVNISAEKTLEIEGNTKTDQNYIVNQKRQVSLKEFLNTNSMGHKPLESEIDTVLSCIAKNL